MPVEVSTRPMVAASTHESRFVGWRDQYQRPFRSAVSRALKRSPTRGHVDGAIEGQAAMALPAAGLLPSADPDPGTPVPPARALIALSDDDSSAGDFFFMKIVGLLLIEAFPQ